MATKVKLRANPGSSLILFAETESGKFGTSLTTTDNVTCESASDAMNVVAVSGAAGYRCSRWSINVPTSGYTEVDTTHIIFNGSLSGYSTSYPQSRTSASGGGMIHIVDDHGTHIGTPTGDSLVGSGFAFGVKHETTNDGWVFLGWRVTLEGPSHLRGLILSSGGSTSGDVTTFDAEYSSEYAIVCKSSTSTSYDVTVEALYRSEAPVVKTVTLNPNGGSVSPATIDCTVGSTYGVLPIPTRDNWRFLGWFDSQVDGNQIDGDTPFTDTSPTTLWAHWEEIPVGVFVLVFDDAGGSGGPGSVEIEEGDSYTIPSDPPTREFYTFEHWLSNCVEYNPGDTLTPTGDMTFIAIWSGGPRPPRPAEQKDFMVYSSGSSGLAFSSSSGYIAYAV